MKAEGHFFRELSSKEEVGEIDINKTTASITSAGMQICQNVKIQSIQCKKDIYLNNGFLFTLSEPLTLEQEHLQQNKYEKIINWLEIFSFKKAFILSLILLIGLISLRFALTSSINLLVAIFPTKIEEKIGQNAYNSLKYAALQETELRPDQISKLRSKANEIASVNGLRRVDILFHKSELFGANALAFPGGPIVVTDDLVQLLDNDTLIIAVIAHELAHIDQRHSLHQIIEIIGIAAVASVLFGSTDSLIEEASLVAINLWASKKSRQFEKEADLFALNYLETSELDKNSLARAIEQLTRHVCKAAEGLEFQNCLKKEKNSWFASHPSSAERLKYLVSDDDM